jgi:hypothetical protein
LRALWSAALLLGVLGVAGVSACYNPTFKGSFKCNHLYYAGQGDCPDGYSCSPATDLCVKGSVSAIDGGGQDLPAEKPAMETHPEVAMDVPPEATPDLPAEAPPVCIPPVQPCTSDMSKKCDPLCQTGCNCQEKCSAITTGAMSGTLTCNVPLPSRARALGEACDVSSGGTAQQTDNCAPGLVCRDDACGSRCYKLCKIDADCPMSTCTIDLGGGTKVCDVQATTCNPVGNSSTPMGCPGMVQGCYLSTTVTDRTVCDCPFKAGGPQASCVISRDCFPGLVCVDATGTGNATCHQACNIASPDCGGLTCMPFNRSKKYGFCN